MASFNVKIETINSNCLYTFEAGFFLSKQKIRHRFYQFSRMPYFEELPVTFLLKNFDDLHFGSFIQYIFITANVVLLTLKRRVFIVAVFLRDLERFVKNKSIWEGSIGFSKDACFFSKSDWL